MVVKIFKEESLKTVDRINPDVNTPMYMEKTFFERVKAVYTEKHSI